MPRPMATDPIQVLVSLPPAAVSCFKAVDPDRSEERFVASDPPGRQIGSGGGSIHLILAAWKHRTGGNLPFDEWMNKNRLLLVHGSGESRRLPGYAAAGKPMTPLPLLPDFPGQRPDSVLLDIQLRNYEHLFWHAPNTYRTLIACGDVLILPQQAPPTFPRVDILIAGIQSSAEEASHHGVMICPVSNPGELGQFLQKPPVEILQKLSESHRFFLDTGIWFLSARALKVLMERCGISGTVGTNTLNTITPYDLYSQFGPALGHAPLQPDPAVSSLSTAVLPLENARFLHFGANQAMIQSVNRLLRPETDRPIPGMTDTAPTTRSSPVVLHAEVPPEMLHGVYDTWIENSCLTRNWHLHGRHILTGIPPNGWTLNLPTGTCLDVIPLAGGSCCLRPYGFDDAFRGRADNPSTRWMGKPLMEWFVNHGIDPMASGFTMQSDCFDIPLFPSVTAVADAHAMIEWMLAPHPSPQSPSGWLKATRLSARDLLVQADVATLAAQRRTIIGKSIAGMNFEHWSNQMNHLDLSATARMVVREHWPLPEPPGQAPSETSLRSVHADMFYFQLAQLQKQDDPERHARKAFSSLRDILVSRMEQIPVQPHRNVLDDQIVWGRAPIRLDLAGGWTDTPPYCIEYGGQVTNVAVNMNGQPPIQVFGRFTKTPEIVIRSIDLGIDLRITTRDELLQYATLGDGFGIAKAALALAGLEPRFHGGRPFDSLRHQLEQELGGGIELSMVCAIPKGSGLGTSSILAATLLGTLNDMLGLNWSQDTLFARTMILEQLLTSGGGWQDQVGGISGGIKLIETQPGLFQQPVLRWLPDAGFKDQCADRSIQLYYTGLTRIAHGILGEIVRGLFLNQAEHLSVIRAIGHNARFTADAIQRNDLDGLREGVRRSWVLNQRLDSGTNPPAVQAILDTIHHWNPACKLLGAGGGGYLLIMAPDAESGHAIRAELLHHPPNPRARFVELEVSPRGMEVSRS